MTNKTARAAIYGLALCAAMAALPAFADTADQHLRGQITSVSDGGFMMKTEAGAQRRIVVSSKTKIAAVVPGNLSAIEKGTFIGTANAKHNGRNQALEMVIFPASMKGAGLGDYGWDLSPASNGQSGSQMAGSGTSMSSGSSMTNGTVTAKSSGGAAMSSGSSMTNGTVTSKSGGAMSSGSSMTNGTVTQQSKGSGRSITLNVDYGKGSKMIMVPADVPVVKVQPGSASDLKTGAHVFVAGPKSSGTFDAARVIVGKNGTVPPM